jgi:hypothetical protein
MVYMMHAFPLGVRLNSRVQNDVTEFDYVYTQHFRICPPYKFEFGTCIKARYFCIVPWRRSAAPATDAPKRNADG